MGIQYNAIFNTKETPVLEKCKLVQRNIVSSRLPLSILLYVPLLSHAV